jgi:protein-L-isoaspartate(D-aspartate) O-methyltransferase
MIRQLAERGIKSQRVLDAMRTIPRETFIDEALRGKAYSDHSLPIGQTQTISQPWIVARMSELIEPTGQGKVLEIGSGSGYQAAILSKLFELVYSVERKKELSTRARQVVRQLGIQNVHFKIFDGSYGWSEFAPYRAILVTAAAREIPTPLIDQLQDGGHLVLPLVSTADQQVLTRIPRLGTKLRRESLSPCKFVPLVGKFGDSE